MKAVFGVFLLAGLAYMSNAGTIHLTNSKMTLTGTGTIKVNPVESLWSGLTKSRRFPMILSGDLIALKLARSSGKPYWVQCSKSSYCTTSTCPGGPIMRNSKFSSCPRVVFRIRALGKSDGNAVESGDYVAMSFPRYGETRYFYCQRSTSTPCYGRWNLGYYVWPKKYWLGWNRAKFQIFARNAAEGSPIQYGDLVGFKYDYQSSKSWLYSDRSRIYARSCSYGDYSKSYCTRINSGFGFQIYKKYNLKPLKLTVRY